VALLVCVHGGLVKRDAGYGAAAPAYGAAPAPSYAAPAQAYAPAPVPSYGGSSYGAPSYGYYEEVSLLLPFWSLGRVCIQLLVVFR